MREFLRASCTLLLMMLLIGCNIASAATDGVYHPYVSQTERELEYGITWRDLDGMTQSFQRSSFAYGWTDRFATEIYFITESPSHSGSRIRGYEVEAKWQLTEQGEYWADWGLLLEVESSKGAEQREVSLGVLWEKELGNRWVAAANAIVEYEFGSRIDNEFETALRMQARYLHSPALEPAVELYLDDQDYAIGPALLGAYRVSAGRQIRWDIGIPLGIKSRSPSRSLRVNLEFEF